MSDDRASSRQKWNRIYDQQVHHQGTGQPAAVLTENLHWLPAKGRALDIACGTGLNAIFLAKQGLQVDAWDISDTAIRLLSRQAQLSGLSIQPVQMDICAGSLTPNRWDVIVNCHYLDRSIIPDMRAALTPGGLLFIQTFTADKQVDLGPSNPQFLLQKDELLGLTQNMEVLAYRNEGSNNDVAAPLAGRAYVVARSLPASDS